MQSRRDQARGYWLGPVPRRPRTGQSGLSVAHVERIPRPTCDYIDDIEDLLGGPIRTTQKYYLSVREDDIDKARAVQAELMKPRSSDPKVTHSVEMGDLEGGNAKELMT